MPLKLREGNGFTGVSFCQQGDEGYLGTVSRGSIQGEMVYTTPSPERIGGYFCSLHASYWNAVLFCICFYVFMPGLLSFQSLKEILRQANQELTRIHLKDIMDAVESLTHRSFSDIVKDQPKQQSISSEEFHGISIDTSGWT